MEQKTLTGSQRTKLKKAEAGRLRKQGKIPAVIYGHDGSTAICVDAHEFNTKFHTVSENTIIKLTVDGNDKEVLVKDFQEDIIRGAITHVDFFEIEKGKVLRTNIPIHLTGTALGTREGGILEQLLHELEVECLPKDIPVEIIVDVSELEINQSIHVSDLDGIDGVKFLSSEDQVIAICAHAKAEVVETEDEDELEGEEAELDAEESEEESEE